MIATASSYFKNMYDCEETNLVPELPKINIKDAVPAITKAEVRNAIDNQKRNKSPGPDGIRSEMLKADGTIMIEHVKNLFNSIMLQEEIPHQWKTAKIIFLHKKGSINTIDNYRPISLCSTVSKVFPSILKQRFPGRIMECICEDQAGFRKDIL